MIEFGELMDSDVVRQILRGSLLSLLARLVAAPVVAICLLTSTWLVVGSLGSESYSMYALVIGVLVMLPFTDLGLGVAVMDVVARRQSGSRQIIATLKSSLKILCFASAVLLATAWLGRGFSVWSYLLAGAGADIDTEVAFALSLFALGLPLSLGVRVLTGLELNHVTVGFQALTAVITVSLTAAAIALNGTLLSVSLVPFLSLVISNALASLLAARKLGLLRLWRDTSLPIPTVSARQLFAVAGPMLVITMILPFAYQSDRFIIAHVGTLDQVAQYALAYALFGPLLGIAGSAASALWPAFIRHTTRDSVRKPLLLIAALFFLGGCAVALLYTLFGPFLARVVGGGEVDTPQLLYFAFGSLLIVQCTMYPLSMFLTTPADLRFQAALHVAMLVFNIPLSILGAYAIGPAGPVFATSIAMFVALFLPKAARALYVTRNGLDTRLMHG